MQWKKSESIGGPLPVSTYPEPTKVIQTATLQESTKVTGSRSAIINFDGKPNLNPAVTEPTIACHPFMGILKNWNLGLSALLHTPQHLCC